MRLITRRQFLATTAAAGVLTAMPTLLTGKGSVFAATDNAAGYQSVVSR